jgi:hypothetical protein
MHKDEIEISDLSELRGLVERMKEGQMLLVHLQEGEDEQ